MRRRLLIGVLVAAAIPTAVAGCGGSTHTSSGTSSSTSSATSSSASSSTTPAAALASRPLSPEVATEYVDAQVRALCLVQSKAYPTEKALEAAYVQAEHSGNLSAHDFAQAVAATTHDVALRKRISDRVAAVCGKH